ncbi:hypothetical protein-transmembrane prediction [Rhodopirellula baltica SH 1]|uniref:Uncharacterized protein n=1 Tax=Rhodopirellula baltica (strain DSM 10527 / NCIMB 13988 / SH1) TaxID=243090 RepID=Q7UI99_RHOBA|nr:hypothetical protein-transmembrane prediction [Rhodopirellula baltica SH 1]
MLFFAMSVIVVTVFAFAMAMIVASVIIVTVLAMLSMAVMRFLERQIIDLRTSHQSERCVANSSFVSRSRFDVELAQHAIAANVSLGFRNSGFGIRDVAELDRIGWASSLASGDDFTIANRTAAVFASVDLGVLDALDTVGALFHDPTTANGDIGVEHQLLQFAVGLFDRTRVGIDAVADTDFFVVIEVVEAANFVGAVVRTVPRADAAVVGHRVETFVCVNRRRDGANLFARCGFAVHAGDRFLNDVSNVWIALEVAVDSQPMHFAAVADLFFADDRHVVFALTSNHAAVATKALGQVDRHAPLRHLLLGFFDRIDWFFPKRTFFANRWDVRSFGFGELRQLVEQFQRAFANQAEAAAFGFVTSEFINRPVVLGRDQFVLGVTRTRFDRVSVQHRIRESDWRHVDTDWVDTHFGRTANRTDTSSAVADLSGDDAGCTTGHLVNGQFNRRITATNRDHQTVLDSQCFRGARAHDRRVVPNQLRQGLRQLLQPTVVGKATVVKSFRCGEDHFDVILINVQRDFGKFTWQFNGCIAGRDFFGRNNNVFGETVVQQLSPLTIADSRSRNRIRGAADQFFTIGDFLVQHQRQDFCGGATT